MKSIFTLLVCIFYLSGFSQKQDTIKDINKPQLCTKEETFLIVDQMPVFPGGDIAFRKYIQANIQYPDDCKKNHIEGKVYVRFAINSEGNTDNISIATRVNPLLENEAIRVIKNSPKWKPGKKDGKNVCVWFTAPVIFKL